MRGFVGSTAALLGILGPSSTAWAQPGDFHDGPHMWGDGSWMVLGLPMMIVFIAAIVVIVVLVVRLLRRPGHGGAPYPPPGRTPLHILEERFARGEIDKEEFDGRRCALAEYEEPHPVATHQT